MLLDYEGHIVEWTAIHTDDGLVSPQLVDIGFRVIQNWLEILVGAVEGHCRVQRIDHSRPLIPLSDSIKERRGKSMRKWHQYLISILETFHLVMGKNRLRIL